MNNESASLKSRFAFAVETVSLIHSTFIYTTLQLYDADQIGQDFNLLGKDSICFHGKTAPCPLFSPCIRSAQEQGYR